MNNPDNTQESGPEEKKYVVPKIEEKISENPLFQEQAYVFANDVQELHTFGLNLQKNSHYQMIRCAGILRRLFLDKHSLCRSLSKAMNQKIWVVRHERHAKPTENSLENLPKINQDLAPHYPKDWFPPAPTTCCYSLDEYLKVWLGTLAYHRVTPKLIIKLYANKLGGVHFDPHLLAPSGNKESSQLSEIYAMSTSTKVMGQNPASILFNNCAFDLFHAANPLLWTLIGNGLVEDSYRWAPASSE